MTQTPAARRRRLLLGFTLVEVLVVTAIITSIPTAQYARAKQKTEQVTCGNQLRQVGQLLVMELEGNETMPNAAFYPKDPKAGGDSLVRVLAGGDPRLFTCPGLPPALQEKGLNFVYNNALAGKKVPGDTSKVWVLIEMTCVSPDAGPPHPEGYNILYADGHVACTRELPPEIIAIQKQVAQQQKTQPTHK
jgi:prepilin-type processing-associated H-X9-DG protein/prepilin-type N-terminal cleavage/methylation domain-containing protein